MDATRPVTVAIANDYEVVVRGVLAMLTPFADRVEIVELDAQLQVLTAVDVTLYDTFAAGQVDDTKFDQVLGDQARHVVVYSWNMHPQLVEVALSKGCRGYLDKTIDAESLVDALERVADGDIVVSPTRLPVEPLREEAEALPYQGDWPARTHGLSPREAEVLALIAQGLTNLDIASQTYLSINSVKTYIRSAYRKIGVTRRSQAVLWGIHHDLLPDVMRDTDPEGAPAAAGA
ncbi:MULTISPECIES: DNA-binding response regulator [unclassified Ornithinimicrobium]|uniref:response regulator transcription factor n=1 Tax=unclassified Ornithinimicrobium TaxID=2615080 RepID=UPI0038551AE2